jgi:hypothetical protein
LWRYHGGGAAAGVEVGVGVAVQGYQAIVIVWVKPNGTVRSTALWTRLRAWPTPWATISLIRAPA